MKILFIADVKPPEPLEILAKDCELIILLGDLFYEWISDLKNIDIPILGVHGNHDYDKSHNPTQMDLFKELNGIDLHLKHHTFKGITFAGFDGAMGYVYAENDAPYHIELDRKKLKEDLANFSKLGPCNVLITHFPPLGIHDLPFMGHRGIKVFRDYIDAVQAQISPPWAYAQAAGNAAGQYQGCFGISLLNN